MTSCDCNVYDSIFFGGQHWLACCGKIRCRYCCFFAEKVNISVLSTRQLFCIILFHFNGA